MPRHGLRVDADDPQQPTLRVPSLEQQPARGASPRTHCARPRATAPAAPHRPPLHAQNDVVPAMACWVGAVVGAEEGIRVDAQAEVLDLRQPTSRPVRLTCRGAVRARGAGAQSSSARRTSPTSARCSDSVVTRTRSNSEELVEPPQLLEQRPERDQVVSPGIPHDQQPGGSAERAPREPWRHPSEWECRINGVTVLA